MRNMNKIRRKRPFGASDKKNGLKNIVIQCGVAMFKCGLFIVGVWAEEKIRSHFREKKQQSKKSSGSDTNESKSSSPDKTTCKQKPVEETLNDTLDKHIDIERVQLVGNLIHSGETCVLYSQTDAGKTTFAMQVGLDIAGGNESKLIPGASAGIPQLVYYYDTELRDVDLQHRYKGRANFFPDNFIRLSNWHFTTLDELADDISEKVARTEADCTIIIDNITQGGETHNARAVNNFYNRLDNLKSDCLGKGRYITIIIVTHTSKSNSMYSPIEFRDMSGSSALYNFANSVIVLGMTCLGEDTRMIKALKGKFSGKTGDVMIVKFVENPYLHFEYVCTKPECEVLPIKLKADRQNKKNSSAANKIEQSNSRVTPGIAQKMKQMADSGMRQGKIGQRLGFSRRTVNQTLQQFK